MGDAWSGTTEYDKNQNKRDERDARRRADERAGIDQRLGNTLNNPGSSMEIYGNNDQLANIQANLSQVGVMTGQNVFQTGQQQQDYYRSLQDRRAGDDAVAANMMAGRNRNLANVGRQFAGKGVAGGVAAAGMNSATNTADSEINAQKQTFGRQNDADLWNYVKRNQKVEGEALSGGSDQGLASSMDTSQASGIFGTVICTELHRQGIMSDAIYLEDQKFGWELRNEDPYAFIGYYHLASPIAQKMKTSKLLTSLISPFAMAWARNMAGEKNLLGSLILKIGIPVCRMIGRHEYTITKAVA